MAISAALDGPCEPCHPSENSYPRGMKASLWAVVFSIGLLTGCIGPIKPGINPFQQFYQDTTQQMPPAIQQRLIPPSGPPQIETVARAQLDNAVRSMLEHGFIQIGFASFDGPPASREQLMEQAQKVGAQAVTLTGEYARTAEGVRPSLSFQPGQTYTTQERGTVTASTFGAGNPGYGYGTYSGSSTTTTPGSFQTQYTPYQMPIYSQGALFWRKLKPGIFGASGAPIPDELRDKLQRNTGVFISTIVEGSPAFNANVMRGDVIIEFADKPISTFQELNDLLPTLAGQTVKITVLRGGETKVLEVHLNPRPDTSPIISDLPGTNDSLAMAKAELQPTILPKQFPQASQRRTNSLGMVFVPVPGTSVLFCIWDTRVQDFQQFVDKTGYDATAGMYSFRSDGQKQRGDTWKHPGFAQGPTHPVCGVSWDDAQAFCHWLTKNERRAGTLAAKQSYRLPTDTEWSAAVGFQKYPWGNQWPPPPGAGNYAGVRNGGCGLAQFLPDH